MDKFIYGVGIAGILGLVGGGGWFGYLAIKAAAGRSAS